VSAFIRIMQIVRIRICIIRIFPQFPATEQQAIKDSHVMSTSSGQSVCS
jgi:hypothetical protein